MPACRHDEINSFRLFKEAKAGLQIIKYFSQRHRLHLLEVKIKKDLCNICLMERTTSLTTFHSTSTKNLTTPHALLATFHNLLTDDCPRFRTIKNPLTKQHPSIRKPSTTADTTTFSHFLHTSRPTLHTLEEGIGRETLFGTTPHLARMSPLTSGVLFLSYLTRNSP